MNVNKKTAIVTGGTKNQFPAMAVLALNIADKTPGIADELVIFHDGININEQEKINKIFPTKFIEYNSPFKNKYEFENNVTNYFSFMVFCKYECWRLLDEYSTVIWCDYDIIFLKNVEELKNTNDFYCAFIQDHSLVRKFNTKLFWKYEERAKNIPLSADGICACLFVLKDSFPNYSKFYELCIKTTIEYSEALNLPEEAVISLLINENQIIYKHIDDKIYALQPGNNIISEKTKGLHSCGTLKFWNGLQNEQWNEYYKKWLEEYNGQGFEEIKKVKRQITLKKIIKSILPYGVIRIYQRKKYEK